MNELDSEQRVPLDPSLWARLNLSTDPAYVELRRRHYGEHAVDLVGPRGAPVGLFLRTRLPIRRIPVRFMSPLVGWESTGWLGCDGWGQREWREAVNVLAKTKGWDIVQSLAQSPSEAAELRQAAAAAGLRTLDRLEPVRVVHGFGSWEGYLRSLSKRKRQRYKDTQKVLQKSGLRITRDVSHEEIQALYERRVLRMNPADQAKTSGYQAFLKDWRACLESEKRLETVGVWQGDRLVAMALGFWRDRVFSFNFTAYDPEFRALSPGSIAIYKLLELTLDAGAELFSFMGNFEYEKLYTSQTLESHRVDVFSRSLRGRIFYRLMSRRAG